MDDLRTIPPHRRTRSGLLGGAAGKLQTLYTPKLLYSSGPKLAGTGGVATAGGYRRHQSQGQAITVNDWAKAKGLTLSSPEATEVGMRQPSCTRLSTEFRPAQRPRGRGQVYYVRDMRRPWKERISHLPTSLNTS